MKCLRGIEAAGPVAGGFFLGVSSPAAGPQKDDDFYQIARKTAESYRGQLFSTTEMAQFVDELSRLTSGPTEPVALLNSLKKNPYDETLNAQALRWLESECKSRGDLAQVTVLKLTALK